MSPACRDRGRDGELRYATACFHHVVLLTICTQIIKYQSYMDILMSTECKIRYPVSIPDLDALTVDGEEAIISIACQWPIRNHRFGARLTVISLGI